MTEEKRYAEKYCEDCGAFFSIPEMHKIEKDGRTIGWRCKNCQKNAQSNDAFWIVAGLAFIVTFGLVGTFIADNWVTLTLCTVFALFTGAYALKLESDGHRVIAWVISCVVIPFASLASMNREHVGEGLLGLAIAFFWARYLYKTRDHSARDSED